MALFIFFFCNLTFPSSFETLKKNIGGIGRLPSRDLYRLNTEQDFPFRFSCYFSATLGFIRANARYEELGQINLFLLILVFCLMKGMFYEVILFSSIYLKGLYIYSKIWFFGVISEHTQFFFYTIIWILPLSSSTCFLSKG